jgi:hypothetical protein
MPEARQGPGLVVVAVVRGDEAGLRLQGDRMVEGVEEVMPEIDGELTGPRQHRGIAPQRQCQGL